ncbi:unnamed protein product [Cuscuta epithymum]|uniref:Xyloglucan endotransglucosylase/hydrolase n=1 Tax=Cuscuta epithymum TaxID=186058 RepID=A0AAV0CCS8_9ASTE|nr:unnamed protein product [Cuscuta epithymum]
MMVKLFISGLAVAVAVAVTISAADDVPFDDNYSVEWGNDHVTSFNHGMQVQLSLDQNSGSRFGSKSFYGSGFFEMRMKVPPQDSAGVVTAFYLTSNTENGRHDELDFEFLGNREGKPITLQTNVITEGIGNREERIILWFDPSADFHSYQILWNQHQVVFYVDNTPIRVFKNNAKIGVEYPSSHPMQIECSLWNGESWATDGGRSKIIWTHSPFKAEFQGFNVDACQADNNLSSSIDHCSSLTYWWNQNPFWTLNDTQQTTYTQVRHKYMNYDYCADLSRFSNPPPECVV